MRAMENADGAIRGAPQGIEEVGRDFTGAGVQELRQLLYDGWRAPVNAGDIEMAHTVAKHND